MIRTGIAVGLALALAAAGARAGEIEDLASEVGTLAARLRDLDGRLRTPAPPGGEAIERRLIEAQVLYQLKSYEEASIILTDVLEKSPNHEEAAFLLAEALYQRRDLGAARGAFERVLERPTGKHFHDALARLIDIALATGEHEAVEAYFQRFSAGDLSRVPAVAYLRGKYLYFRGDFDQALQTFQGVAPGHPYHLQATYFIGATQVARGDLDGALATFRRVAAAPAKTPTERAVVESAHLALGRVHYEKGDFSRAIDEYEKIGRESERFPEALYEIAWTYVKAQEYQKAMQAVDLLLVASPDSPQAPEVRLLMGNLLIRLGEPDRATALFEKTRDEFRPVYQDLRARLDGKEDPRAYFAALLGRGAAFDASVTLPPLALAWLKQDDAVGRAVRLVGDIVETQQSVDESEALIRRLEAAVSAPGRVNIFDELAILKAGSLEVENRLLRIRTRLAAVRRELVAPVLSAVDRSELDRLGRERSRLEAALGDLPTSAAGYEQRARKARRLFGEVEKRAQELAVLIESLNAQLNAVEKYYRDTLREQKVAADVFARQLEEGRALVEALRREHDQVRVEIKASQEGLGVDDLLGQEEARLKAGLREALGREQALLARARGALGGTAAARFDRIEGALASADGVNGKVDAFNRRIDEIVEARLAEVRKVVEAEKGNVAGYRERVKAVDASTRDFGAETAQATLADVTQKVYDLVVRSEVGVIDVAWALKDEKTQTAIRLRQEESRERKLLDREFREVLQDR